MIKSSPLISSVMAILKFLFLAVLMLMFIFPFIMVVLNAFKTDGDFLTNPMSLPKEFVFKNFSTAFEKMNFIKAFSNSLIVTVLGTSLIILFSSMAAYWFVRNASKFNNFVFYSMVGAMIIPFQAVMIPLVGIYFGKLRMPSNKWLLIYMCIGFGISQAVFMYSGFIKGISRELDEAAMIDGCSRLRTFFMIIFPLLTPITVTIIIIDVLWIWNDFLLPTLIVGTSIKEYTLPLSTYKFFGTYTAQYTLIMASLLMTMAPVIVMYLFLQKFIVAGLTQGAVKG